MAGHLRSRAGVGLFDQASQRHPKFGAGWPWSLDSGDRYARTHLGEAGVHSYVERGTVGFDDAMEYARARSRQVGLRVRVSQVRLGSGRGRWVVQPITGTRQRAETIAASVSARGEA